MSPIIFPDWVSFRFLHDFQSFIKGMNANQPQRAAPGLSQSNGNDASQAFQGALGSNSTQPLSSNPFPGYQAPNQSILLQQPQQPLSQQQQQQRYSSTSSTGDTDEHSTMADIDRFGLSGLLSLIRNENMDMSLLGLGTDLTQLGLDLNQPEYGSIFLQSCRKDSLKQAILLGIF